jgi:hypothetical protein
MGAKMKRTASQIGRGSRVKGASYERSVANTLKSVWPGAKRGIGQTRNAGEVPDVSGTPWWIEAKFHKRVNIRKAHEQAIGARNVHRELHGTPYMPVLVVSRDNAKCDLATMTFEMFVDLMRELVLLRAMVDEKMDGP